MKQFNLNSLNRQLKGKDLYFGDLIIEIGRRFLRAPYKTGTLEAGGKEKLVVNFTQFDCFTFLEAVLALAKCAIQGRITVVEFRRMLQFIRYRHGIIAGYSSRLHYFTDWLRDNERKKIIKDIMRRLGGEPRHKKINYMTTHRASYPALKNENEFQKMLIVEKNLSRKTFCVIKKNKVNLQKRNIKTGDIVAFVTEREGLDVVHVGFALWQGKNLHLLHASSKEGGVVISKKTLVTYLKQNKKFTSIIVAHPL
ncbi:MAG: N-acetylmuramoyl-L-alanine amidase-like domain-containing protein [Smithellaceae bacterium]|jgi:uncharacterized protein YneF (UPF0154 family)